MIPHASKKIYSTKSRLRRLFHLKGNAENMQGLFFFLLWTAAQNPVEIRPQVWRGVNLIPKLWTFISPGTCHRGLKMEHGSESMPEQTAQPYAVTPGAYHTHLFSKGIESYGLSGRKMQ